MRIDFMITRKGIKTRLYVLILLLLTGLFQACLKKEYMPPAVGDKVPYRDTLDVSISEALKASSNSVFAEIWRQSGMESSLAANGDSKSMLTVLVPDNQALERIGWTKSKVDNADAEVLNTLVRAYVFKGRITLEELAGKTSGYRAESLLEIPAIRASSGAAPYLFTASLFYTDGAIGVNGKSLGKSVPLNAIDGTIWPIEAPLEVPERTAWEQLQADERFSLYVELLNHTDAKYNALLEEANARPPQADDARNSPVFYDLDLRHASGGMRYMSDFNTWFIPTNDAFHAAGFRSLEDLIEFNEGRGLPQAEMGSESDLYHLVGEFATDTLLDYHHNWGMRFASYDLTRKRNATLFYSSELKPEVLTDHPITAFTEIEYGYYFPMYGETTFHYMPFEFDGNNQMWVKGFPASKVGIIETDINTLNGVIHAVDRLLLPPGFLTNDE